MHMYTRTTNRKLFFLPQIFYVFCLQRRQCKKKEESDSWKARNSNGKRCLRILFSMSLLLFIQQIVFISLYDMLFTSIFFSIFPNKTDEHELKEQSILFSSIASLCWLFFLVSTPSFFVLRNRLLLFHV